jgi:hypothetical protein
MRSVVLPAVILLAWFIPPIPWIVPLPLVLAVIVTNAVVRMARHRPCS